MNKRVYISLPITGTTDYIQRGQKLIEITHLAGYKPVLPYENGLPTPAPDLCHIIIGTLLLLTCSTVYFGKAWWGSKGCKWEYKVAVWAGKVVITEE